MHAVRTTIFHALFFLLFAVLQLASASIYPTLPVQGTVWTAGQSVLVTWADNGIPPTVNTMGPVTIEIWANLNTLVTTLADNIDPKAGSVQVTVPALPGGNQSTYTLHFVSRVPMESIVYSADFKILSGTTPSPTTSTIPSSSAAPSSSPSSSTTTSASITPLTTTSVVVSPVTVPVVNTPVIILITSTSMVTPTVITLGPLSTAPSNVSAANATSTPHPQRLGGNKNAAGRSLDMEKLMFRVMFIIWPVLVGVALTV